MDWKQISERVLAGKQMAPDEALRCLQARDDELLALLDAAFRVRRYYFKRGVHLHVIRNARSGNCSEDCAYCSQSARADGNRAAISVAIAREYRRRAGSPPDGRLPVWHSVQRSRSL